LTEPGASIVILSLGLIVMIYTGIMASQIITILYALFVGNGFGLIKTPKRAECITKGKVLVNKNTNFRANLRVWHGFCIFLYRVIIKLRDDGLSKILLP
jgi:hypothetical protein